MGIFSRKISHNADDGFVLVAVIWIAGLLAVISTAFVVTVRSHTLLARNVVFNTKAEYVADGMAKAVALKLAAHVGLDRSGVITFCHWSSDISVAWRIQDQAGLVDLNTASPQVMAALLAGLGLQKLGVSDVVDFRDPDNIAIGGGAEPPNYNGKSYGPKNAPFALTAEVDQLPGIDDQSFKLLLPLVTVQSQQQGFDPTVAPENLIKILGASGRTDPLLTIFSSPSGQKNFSIDVVVQTKQKARFYRKVGVTLLLQPDRPYAVLSWERGRDSNEWTFPATIQQSCIN